MNGRFVAFTIPFAAVQERSRKARNGWYAPSKAHQYQIGQFALVARCEKGAKIFKGAVHATITAYGLHGDLDNCIKLILDACNKIIYEDDKQVVFITARRILSGNPRMEVEFMEVDS